MVRGIGEMFGRVLAWALVIMFYASVLTLGYGLVVSFVAWNMDLSAFTDAWGTVRGRLAMMIAVPVSALIMGITGAFE